MPLSSSDIPLSTPIGLPDPPTPPRVLMLLTSHRLDCFLLTMDQLFATGEIRHFDHVMLLLNGVTGKHLDTINRLIAAHPEIPWETLAGPRGKGPLVAGPQNECVRRHPDALFFKIDEDILVPQGWVERMTAAWRAHYHDPKLSLLTPVVTNNATGFHFLVHTFPELKEEFHRRFPAFPLTTEVAGPVWAQPAIAEWILRAFIHLEEGNQRLAQKIASKEIARYSTFAHRFSINNLVYDKRHWDEMGGIPDGEEPAWTQWVADHHKHIVLVHDTLLHHYSFFVQQDWLDRTSLLEDLRSANAAATRSNPSMPIQLAHRASRVIRQVPAIVRRRLGRSS